MTVQLLQQVRVIDPVAGLDQINDVLLVDGVIAAIAPHLTSYPDDTVVRDCTGLVLGPGLVDLYSQSGEPGFEERETLESLCRAAAAGGFTRLVVLPTTQPTVDTPATVSHVDQLYRALPPHLGSLTKPQLYLWGALTQGANREQMTELAELATAGIVGFADGRPLANSLLLRRILDYAQPLNLPIALWPCDLKLVGNGVLREGAWATRLGLPGNPAIAETTAIATIIECVAAIGTPVHLMRISTARSVALIQAAQAQGLPITASTSWLHLLLDAAAIAGTRGDTPDPTLSSLTPLMPYDPHLRLDPPLGNLDDQQALRDAVRQGIIEAIAIDHTPHTYEEKTVAFAEAPAGAIGLELALPLLWQGLVATGHWSALELWCALSTAPARCLNQTPPLLAPGAAAELTLFDPNCRWSVTPATLQSCSINTPWRDRWMTGRVIQTWLSN